jgi:hypothetical protein
MDENDLLSSFQILNDNQRDLESANEMMFKKRRNESMQHSLYIISSDLSLVTNDVYLMNNSNIKFCLTF